MKRAGTVTRINNQVLSGGHCQQNLKGSAGFLAAQRTPLGGRDVPGGDIRREVFNPLQRFRRNKTLWLRPPIAERGKLGPSCSRVLRRVGGLQVRGKRRGGMNTALQTRKGRN